MHELQPIGIRVAKTKRRIALSPQWQNGRNLDDVGFETPELLTAAAALDTALIEQIKPSRVSRARKRIAADDVLTQDVVADGMLGNDVSVKELTSPDSVPDLMTQDSAQRDSLKQTSSKYVASKQGMSKPRAIESGPAVRAFRELIASRTHVRDDAADFSEPLTGDPAPAEPEVVIDRPVLPAVVAPVHAPSRHVRSGSDYLAYLAAVALASVAGYFSVSGMAEIFPGAPWEVMTLAATMEGGKLIIVGWLASHWRDSGWRLRGMLTLLVLGLALINGIGVFGKLVEAHVGAVTGVQAQVAGKLETMDVRISAQGSTVADLDRRIAQIDSAVDEATKRGRVNAAMALAEQKRRERDALSQQRGREAATLTALRTERAALGGERAHAEAAAGPVRYLATLAGTDTETAVRWLILLMVACCDPAAIGLTIAAAGRKTVAA
jgi:hypothetical protein